MRGPHNEKKKTVIQAKKTVPGLFVPMTTQ